MAFYNMINNFTVPNLLVIYLSYSNLLDVPKSIIFN